MLQAVAGIMMLQARSERRLLHLRFRSAGIRIVRVLVVNGEGSWVIRVLRNGRLIKRSTLARNSVHSRKCVREYREAATSSWQDMWSQKYIGAR